MTDKVRKKPTRKVTDLRVKSVSADKAKQVKGGPGGHPWIKRAPTA
jgi:hypothetical protein